VRRVAGPNLCLVYLIHEPGASSLSGQQCHQHHVNLHQKGLALPCHACMCSLSCTIVLCRYVSRDRNIVQFYGACVQTNSLLLVIELMEVMAAHIVLICCRTFNCTLAAGCIAHPVAAHAGLGSLPSTVVHCRHIQLWALQCTLYLSMLSSC
jgi:hypothetical protein